MKSKQKTKQIPLTQGKFAIVDAEDYDRLSRYKWHARKDRDKYRARRSIWRNGKGATILMHREILHVPEGIKINHINHNGLDNRKVNLRLSTQAQSAFDQRPQEKRTSSFKGVCRETDSKKWRADIKYNRKRHHIGAFDNEKDAAEAYDAKAIELFGEFAHLNFPEDRQV